MEDIILVGYGGHGKSVADTIERMGLYHIVGYTDQKPVDTHYQYLGKDEVLQHYYNEGAHNAAICVGYLGKGSVRQGIYNNLKKIGFALPIIVDPSAVVSPTVVLEEGVFVGKQTVINRDAVIKKMSIINTKALIEHECIINEFAHVAVAAVLCGRVCVGKAAFVGANSTVIQNMTIGDGQIIPAGCVVR